MQVLARISFVSTLNGVKHRVQVGDVLELPKGADWLQAGLVEPVKAEAETASLQAPETAVKRTASPRKRKSE